MQPEMDAAAITVLLKELQEENSAAADHLIPIVFRELRNLAELYVRREGPSHTLQPTALVHEAYLRLVDAGKGQHWGGRRHFLAAAAEALRRTALYARERVQFGRPIGSMQAVQQRAADAFIDVEAMRSTYLRAAWVLSRDETAMAEVATAKYWAAIGGHRVVHAAQHLHGGLGADISYPIHRYFLAATQAGLALGGSQPMLALIGSEIAAGKAPRLT